MAKTEKDPAKVVLSTHRVSYVHLKEPSSFKNSDKKDYMLFNGFNYRFFVEVGFNKILY